MQAGAGALQGHPQGGPSVSIRPSAQLRSARIAAKPQPIGLQVSSARRHAGVVPHASLASGSGDGGVGKNPPRGNGGGGNGGSGGSSGSGDSANNEPKKSGMWQGWEERVAYDPEFPIKVLLEQIIGVGASVIGDMSSRPNWGLNELDFVFSTLVVGSIMNFSIMYLLAPTAGAAAASAAGGNFIARALSEAPLRSWGAPGGNMFEAGNYSAGARLLNFAYKGTTFAAIGFIAGIAGTAISNGLLALRKQMDPNFKLVNEQPNVFANAGCWAMHMGLSSNLRYQVLGGVDPMVSKVMPIAAFRVYQAGIRALNNVAGGISFVTLARVLGVQKAASQAAPAAATLATTSTEPATSTAGKSKKH